jgi:hypothetical protein
LYKNGSLSILSSIEKREKSKVDGDNSHVVFGKKFRGEKREV